MQNFEIFIVCGISVLWATALQAEQEPLSITSDSESVSFDSAEGPITLRRFANDIMLVKGPIRPMVPVPGVTPVGELEVISALQDPEFIVVDTRSEETQYGGTIPGTANIPDGEIAQRLDEVGCGEDTTGWECQQALNVVLYCNGPNCGQSPRAMREMVDAGFPATKIFYYRGGMLAWTSLGLTTRESEHSN